MITDADITKLKETFATKEDLKSLATKNELKEEIGELRVELGELRDRVDVIDEKLDVVIDKIDSGITIPEE